MEDLVPAQWTGEEATFELNLCKTCRISHFSQGKGMPPGRCSGHWVLSSQPPFPFMDLSTLIFLRGSASLSFSVHVVCVKWIPNPGSR